MTTFERPQYLKQVTDSIAKHLLKVVDYVVIYDDGSTKEYPEIGFEFHRAKKNRGVAYAKNWILKRLLEKDCDYLFLAEDDIIVKSPKAITEYIRLSNISGIEHMMFAHHGEANKNKLTWQGKGIDLYRNPIGAWCFYTRKVIQEVGLFDENFINSWEHVYHSWQIAKAGYTPPWGASVADLSRSREYLEEIPDSINNSSINARDDHMANKINGLIYWQRKDKDFPLNHILESLLKEEDEAYKKLGRKNPRYDFTASA